ncbi:Copia protein [Vitis vinifera]|uniref:Copia protein n=1 Tax=Vitis vinifera TaxID=29760 RepID=A0A438K2D0_VITVI|nr:Copia protein [Vitis vinifera]
MLEDLKGHPQSKVGNTFWKFKAKVENESGCKILILRSDNGKEYTSCQLNLFCEEAGIEHQLSAPYTPEQNGVSELRNQFIMEMAKCMLHKKNLPKKFWAEAANTTVFLHNRLSTKAVKNQTPFEAWYGYKPPMTFLKVFGCLCFTYVPQVKRDKLDKKVAAEIFIGYSTISKAYKVFQPHTDTIIISRDVHFMENEEWDWEDSKTKLETSFLDEMEDDPLVRSTRLLSEIYQRCNVAIYEPVDHEEALKESKWKDAMKEELFMIEKKQNLGAFNKYKARLVVKGYAQFFGVDYSETFAPVARLDTIRLLLASSAQLGWKVHQMDVKSAFLNGILQEEIYVEQPKGFVMEDKVYRLHKAFYGLKQAPRAWKKSIPWRIRFTRVVPHAKDTALESKSLSSVGYSRKSYPEVTSQRLARGKLVHFHGWKSLALPSVGPAKTTKFCILALGTFPGNLSSKELEEKNGVCEISQTPKRVVKLFRNTELSSQGCEVGFHLEVPSSLLAAWFVNRSSAKLIDEFKLDMMQVFEMTDLGLMTYFLGMEIKQGKDQVFICQIKYTKEILKKFKMEDCKEMNTPMNQKEKLSKDDGAEKVEETYFRSLIGCLMYLTATRPDILYVVSVLSRITHYASEVHLKAVKRVVRYIKGTVDYGVKFQKIPNMKLFGYSDSDWGGSLDDMKKAEFVAATVTVNQALWLRKKLVDLHMKQTQGTEVFVDNQAIIAISHNPVFHGKTKHFNIKLFFLRGVQKDGDINLRYCKTEEQLADIFTNPCQSLSLSFTDKSLEFAVPKARRSVRS